MEQPAKNKKLFPDFGNSEESEDSQKFSPFTEEKTPQFQVAASFWQSVHQNPYLKSEFDRRVEKAAKEYIEQQAAPQIEAQLAKAHQEGVAKGIQQGMEQVGLACAKLEKIGSDVLAQKEQLLRSHEVIWGKALSHLLRRFLVPLNAKRLSGLQAWIEESVGDLKRQAKIRVALSPAVFSQSAQLVKPDSLPQWEWVEDKNLKDEDLRVELNGGGIFFSSENGWKKLDEKLQEIFGDELND